MKLTGADHSDHRRHHALGRHDPPRPGAAHLSGDTLTHVEPAPADRHPGLAVIPGLVDTHVHFDTNVAYLGPQDHSWPIGTPDEEKALHVLGNALRFAASGVTTTRDRAASPVQIAVAKALDQGWSPARGCWRTGPSG